MVDKFLLNGVGDLERNEMKLNLEGHFTPKKSRTPLAKIFFFKKNPPKIRKNPFVVKESRMLFRKSEMPVAKSLVLGLNFSLLIASIHNNNNNNNNK